MTMKLAMLAPIAWRTPPNHYGPWERVTSLLTEALVKQGIDVTLFATGDSETSAKLDTVCARGYEEDSSIDPKVWECLHIANCFEKAGNFHLIHNNFDFLPLSYSGLVSTPVLTTIHGFSSKRILPVYKKYNTTSHYVSISNADRSPELTYEATVYHGIDLQNFTFCDSPDDYLLFFGRFHWDKGPGTAIEIARKAGRRLLMAGVIQDENYFESQVKPHIDGTNVKFLGSVGPRDRDNLLRKASALLHPINFEEPFGLSIVEAMACGTPTIAYRKGSMPELITDGVDGFLVANVDQGVEAVEKIQAIDRNACRHTAETRFSVETMAANYIRVYEQVLGNEK